MTRLVAATVLGLTLLAAAPAAQTGRREAPSMSLLSLTGRDSFDNYCASCHGTAGRGDGALAASLKTTPSDLTGLARRNGGTFPRQEVSAFIEGTGRQLPAHGGTEMPLWGGIFRWLDSEPRTKVRISNLVAYVESLQAIDELPAAPAVREVSGAELFRAFCASCHGTSGKGDGAMGTQLKRTPPDLTRLQIRNRGAFPAGLLKRIIDGREIAAHGNRTMPVWGEVFTREQGAGRDAADARVDALVVYLLSIQERPAE